jgi:microcompartment protein CcmL/EutN
MSQSDRLLRASEVGLYAFCARAWWLQTVQGVSSRNRAALKAGAQAHARHGAVVARLHIARAVGYLLLGLALLLLVIGVWLHG